MKSKSTCLTCKTLFCLLSIFLGMSSLRAQQVTLISDYVIFGGTATALPGQTAPAAPGYAVQLSSSTNVQGGVIGSNKLIKTTGSSVMNASLYSNGTIVLANSNTVTGKIAAGNTPAVGGTILSAGSNAAIGGNIDVKGNIVIGNNGTVSGIVTHPSGTTYSGPAPQANITGAPSIPLMPALPGIANFSAYPALPDINTTQTITPGLYDDIKLPGNKTLTFSGTGIYVFDLIDNSGTNNFIFDFKNNPTGTIKIYVHNNVELSKINVTTINGGSAGKIFTEVHGTGYGTTKFAFDIASGSSSGSITKWLGTVWAPYAGINIGSGTGNSQVTGALWSGTQVNIQSGVNIVYAPYSECAPPNADAGPDRALDFVNPTTLTGSSTTLGVSYSWQATNGGVIISPTNAATITVSAAGTYILTVTAPAGCSTNDTAVVTGKINNLIGSELLSVNQNFNGNAAPSPFFIIQHDSIMIDIIVKEGKLSETFNLLTTATYGLTNIISNGSSNYIITGLFPITKLPSLNTLGNLIVYIRPYYAGFNNSGLVSTAGDTAMATHLLRSGYSLKGEGIKVGVISDSYNTILSGSTNPVANTAAQDVANGDLPGPGNPEGNLTPVHVLKDYPFKRSDEGRGMLQIIHDIAPKAELYFRTGFISAGDFAAGIDELKQAGCNIIVDDITFITEPFLKDGVVANAVNNAVAGGTTYFSSAGNFGNKSYENAYTPVTAPGGLPGTAHNFGGGDIYQSVTLTPGDYTIVLQWEDDIYSLGQTAAGGTKNDMDIYLTPNTDGTALFGFNRNNTNGDPIEIMPFTVTSTMQTNILVTNNTTGSNPARFKYIIFSRGGGVATFNQFAAGTSTIIGQANAAGAITVGAARYDKVTPYYPGPLVKESFSSEGGTVVNNVQRSKPDIIAPDGGNTTVNLGIDYDNNGFSNFFGTSAAAPHAAAVAALIMEGKKKFLNQVVTTPAEIKSLLQSTARDMNTPGFDLSTGFGFINPDSAMRTFAKPDPVIDHLIVPQSVIPGQTPFTLTVTGQNLSPNTVIEFRGEAVPTTVVNSQEASAQIPAFTGNPSINAYTPPQTNSQLDGGSSDSLYFFSTVKKKITVTADNKTKKYGQIVPELTASVLVDDVPLQNTTYSLSDLGLDTAHLHLLSAVNATTNVGTYLITPSRPFDAVDPADIGLQELYTYTFKTGNLTVEKLPLTVKAQDITVTYGQKIPNTQFTYTFDGTNIEDSVALLNSIQAEHQTEIAKDLLGNDILGLVNGQAVTIVNGQAIPIVNGQAVTIVNGQAVTIVNGQAIPIVNGQAITIVNGQAIPIVNNLSATEIENLSTLTTTPVVEGSRKVYNKTLVNGVYVTDSTNVVDITQESILKFGGNSAQTNMLNAVSQTTPKGMVDIESYTNGQAVTIVNGQAVTIVNGQAIPIVNGQAVTIVNGQAVTIVNGQAIPIVNSQNRTAVIINESEIGQGQTQLKSLNLLTGLDTGEQFIIPGTYVEDNFIVTHVAGIVTILPAPVTITATAGQTKVFGTADPVFTYTNNAGLAAAEFTGNLGRDAGENKGTYAYTLGSLSAGANYTLSLSTDEPVASFSITAKSVIITPDAGQTKVYGSADPVFTFSNDAGLNAAGFTGALGRVEGENTGTYTYTLGSLSAGANYTLALSAVMPLPSFAITVKPVLITPIAGQSKVYGNADPVFTFSNNAGLNTGNFTGALARVSGNAVGSYAYTMGTLTAGNNYSLSLSGTNTFAITKAPLQVKADDKVIFKNDPLPAFTSTLATLKYNDNPTVTYTLSPSCTGSAGVYSIIPSISGFANAGNYNITYVNGKLYINPKGTGAKKLVAELECVEEIVNPAPGQLKYIAHFECHNDNSIPVYIAAGSSSNKLTSTGSFNGATLPSVFAPGETYFDIPFDGVSLRWDIKSYDGSTLKTTSATASSASNRCTTILTQRTIQAQEETLDGSVLKNTAVKTGTANTAATVTTPVKITAQAPATVNSSNTSGTAVPENQFSISGTAKVYPNPVIGKAIIYLGNDQISKPEILLLDAYGKSYLLRNVKQTGKNAIEIDLSGMSSGIYFVRLQLNSGIKMLRLIKE